MCSHFNAVRYWVDTLTPKNGKLFPCHECISWEDYRSGKCKNTSLNYMGFEADPKFRGKFFIKLSSKAFFDGKDFYRYLLGRLEQRVINLINFNF